MSRQKTPTKPHGGNRLRSKRDIQPGDLINLKEGHGEDLALVLKILPAHSGVPDIKILHGEEQVIMPKWVRFEGSLDD